MVPEAVYYSNRAACYMNVSPPQNEQVVSDCDAALELDSAYVKALNRRANALEALGRDEEALRGTILAPRPRGGCEKLTCPFVHYPV